MEGERRAIFSGGGGGFRCKPNPPLSAIDRFLSGQNTTTTLGVPQKNNNQQTSTQEFCLPSTNPYTFSTTCNNGLSFLGFPSWPTGSCIPTSSNTSRKRDIKNLVGEPDYLFFDDKSCSKWGLDGNTTSLMNNRNCVLSASQENQSDDHQTVMQIKKDGKKIKVGCDNSSVLIKGQWAEEEDRKLIKLVMQFGERKWAQIADKLDGRAGKQCRDRWLNHLRPDIKKDGWSEEEERMLIEAHQIVGNRWAEIAKQIPGRTENSIKNHFNATKRRQNSRRKNKPRGVQEGVKSQTTSILQDYIKSSSSSSTNLAAAPTANIAATISNEDPIGKISIDGQSQSAESITGDSPPLIPHTRYDDELHFIQNLFAPSNNNHPAATTTTYPPSCQVDSMNSLPSLNDAVTSTSMNMNSTSHLYSDMYLSYLLNGGGSNINNSATTTCTNNYTPSTGSNDYEYYYDGGNEYDDYMSLNLVQDDHHYYDHQQQQQEEMNLIEMVSHIPLSQGST